MSSGGPIKYITETIIFQMYGIGTSNTINIDNIIMVVPLAQGTFHSSNGAEDVYCTIGWFYRKTGTSYTTLTHNGKYILLYVNGSLYVKTSGTTSLSCYIFYI